MPVTSIPTATEQPVTTPAQQPDPAPTAQKQSGKYVASKSGTKYHLATCPGARTISEANRVWFETKGEAEAAGYAAAANCKGI